MKIRNYMDLDVWKLSKEFPKDIYNVTATFPPEERYGLTNQLRRAAVSIMSNIAEGSGRRSTQEFIRFVNISSGSVCETESQLLLAQDLGFLQPDTLSTMLDKADRISKMLYALQKSLAKNAA